MLPLPLKLHRLFNHDQTNQRQTQPQPLPQHVHAHVSPCTLDELQAPSSKPLSNTASAPDDTGVQPRLLQILCIKTRHNARDHEVTVRRFLVRHQANYYYVTADVKTRGIYPANQAGQHFNIEVTEMPFADDEAALQYAQRDMKGRHLESLPPPPEYRTLLHEAIRVYHQQVLRCSSPNGDTPVRYVQRRESPGMPHENTALPHDFDLHLRTLDLKLDDADTASSLNFSQRSGDTRGDAQADCAGKVRSLVTELRSGDEDDDLEGDFERLAYRDTVGYLKAKEIL